MKTVLKERLLRTSVLAGFAAAGAITASAGAQEAQQTQQADPGTAGAAQPSETIVVTGSRIARQDFTSNSPIATVDAGQFEMTGTVNVESLMNTLPQTIPGFDRTSNNPGNGTATVDLRGLGSGRTLVLVDGVRMVPSTQGATVDLNNIPPALIERVEVVTGGASAVYGSDAIAGVVNFIMKRDFEGVDLRSSVQMTERGDAEIYSISATVGGNFANGRGNAVMNIGWNERQSLLQGERDFSSIALLEDGQGGTFAGGSSLAAPGVLVAGGFADPNPTTGFPGSPNALVAFNPDGSVRPFVDSDFYNYAPVNYLQLPQERFQSTALARYEFNRHAEFYASAFFTQSRVKQQLAETPFLQVLQFTLDGNPFIAPGAQRTISDVAGDTDDDGNLIDTNGNGVADTATVQVRRRMLETGPRIVDDTRTAFQFTAGLTGDINDNWQYDVNYTEGRLNNNSEQLGNISLSRLQQGLLLDLSDPANPVCETPSGGCVPLNIFGEGNVSAAGAEFIGVRVNSAFERIQQITSATVTGDTGNFFNLPGGPVGLAFGAEYQNQFADFRPSDDLAKGNIAGFNASPPSGGSYDVTSLYGEFYAPIFSGERFAEVLAIEGAYRAQNYSTVGSVSAWKLAGEWAPINDVRFRASYNTAVRAPNISELFAPQSEGFPSAQDPCSDAARGTSDGIADQGLCAATGVPAGAYGSAALNAPAGQIRGIFGGNPDLLQEEAETFTVGAVFTPEMVPGLSFSVDYFDITIDERIASFGGGVANILNTCYYDPNVGGAGSPFCDVINRRPDGTIEFVLATSQNIAASKLTGFDIAASYGFDFGGGSFDLSYLGTITTENSIVSFPGAETIECAGAFGQVCGTPDPEYRHRTVLNWTGGALQGNLVWRHIGSTSDDQNDANAFAVTKIRSYDYFDGSLSLDVNDFANVTFGINNLFNEAPPILGENAEQANTFPSMYDVFGRTYYLTLRTRF